MRLAGARDSDIDPLLRFVRGEGQFGLARQGMPKVTAGVFAGKFGGMFGVGPVFPITGALHNPAGDVTFLLGRMGYQG